MTKLKTLQQESDSRFDEQFVYTATSCKKGLRLLLKGQLPETPVAIKSFIHSEQQRVWDAGIKEKTQKLTDWQKMMETLSEEQKENIKAKCRWEGMSWLGVFREWTSLFKNGTNDEIIEKLLKSND